MPASIMVYGDIIGDEARRAIQATHPSCDSKVVWCSKPLLPSEFAHPAVAFVDLDNPDFSSPEFLVSVAQAGDEISVLGKCAELSIDEQQHFAKLGVSEILTPGQCLERLSHCLTDAEVASEPPVVADPRFGYDVLRGKSPHVKRIKDLLRTLADVDFPTALILGETGTGKSLVCKVLHNTGLRQEHNLVEVNCSAIPDELFESELYGHVKGAFTDAKSDKMGLFEFAQNGTLFLDEVGNLSASAQAKLLKVIEDRTLRKVGALESTNINVRVVAATNIDLSRAIDEGRFREDLLHRLNLLVIQMPSLRERPEDIPLLVHHYCAYYATLYHREGLEVSDEAVDALTQHPWPGNVRQLCNVIERMVLLAQSRRIEKSHVRAALKSGRITVADRRQIAIDVPAHGLALDDIETTVVGQVLNMFDWNKSEVARFLQISRPRLRRIIERGKLEQDKRSR